MLRIIAYSIPLLLISNGVFAQQADGIAFEQSCIKYRLMVQKFSDGQSKIIGMQPGDCPDRSTLPAYEQPDWIVPGAVYITLQEPTNENYVQETLQRIVPLESFDRPFAQLLPDEYIYKVTFDPKAMTNRAFLTAAKKALGILANDQYSHSVSRFETVTNKKTDLNDPLRKQQRYLEHIGFDEALTLCPTTTETVPLAIVDNGFATDHPDLQAHITAQYDVAEGDTNASITHEGLGWEHGTVEAGIAGAIANNNLGISSVSNNTVALIVIKGTPDEQPGGNVTAGLEGLAKAADLGAKIISASRGTPVNAPMVEKVTKAIVAKNMLLVAAAGNQNTDKPFYPAAYPGVIGVTAIDANNEKASFANYGDWVTIAAPGVNIITTDLGGRYKEYQGTSEAAPLVAGSIAFAMAHGFSRETLKGLAIPLERSDLGIGVLSLRGLCKEQAEANLIPQSSPTIARDQHFVATESDLGKAATTSASEKIRDQIYTILLIMLTLLSTLVVGSGIRHRWQKRGSA